jgi:hypothetical protein
MKVLKTGIKFYAFEYDFSIDGGALGNYNTGIQPPKQSFIFSAFCQVLTPITSIGLDITFGVASAPAGLGGIPAIVNYDQAASGFINSNSAPLFSTFTGEEIIMNFATNPALTGKVKFIFIVMQANV